jgi:hypothetical protein
MADAIFDPTVYAAWTRGRQPAKVSGRPDRPDAPQPDRHETEQCKREADEVTACPSQISRC